MAETRHTFCRICEALCGLEVDVEAERVVAIRPDKHHVGTAGFGCVKGMKQHLMYDSPDRLLYPLERGDDGVQRRVSWDRALGGIGERIRRIREEHGPDSIAMYVGTAAGFSVLHPVFAQGFMQGIGSRNMYSSATQDCASKFAVARHMYGFPFTQPFPDVDRTECLIIVGANPAVSKWSFGQVPNPVKRLKAIEKRGGRVFVVDPRRTETARAVGEHVFIRPGTDALLFAAFLHELIEIGGVDADRVERYMAGFDRLRDVVATWSPERTAPVTGIGADALREMVAAYCAADGAALYSSTGVNMGGHGALAFWLQECINAVSGNLDRLGGTLVGQGIFDFAKFGARTGMFRNSFRSRVGDFEAVNDGLPGGILADEIETPGAGQVRALFVTGGNPLITMANSDRLRRAFADLELVVTLDILPSETASVSHYVLPCTSPLQRPDLPFVFPLFMGMQTTPYLQATEPVVAPAGEQRDEATIYVDLARACGVNLFGSGAAQRIFEGLRWVHSRRKGDAQPSVPQRWLLDAILRITRQPSFRQLLRQPHGALQAPHRGNDFLGDRVVTDSGRVELAPDALVAEASGLVHLCVPPEDQLVMITKRAITTHNSWTHNLADFVAGDRGSNYLYVNPDDAANLGLAEGDLADVRTATASVRVPVKHLADLMPGTVALPHGWGHQAAPGLSVASETAGVNANLLAADGPESIERISGMVKLTGIPVTVERAAGGRAHTWSGLPST